MNIKQFLTSALLFIAASGFAQSQLNMQPAEVMNLYNGPAPGTENWKHEEVKTIDKKGAIHYFNISKPSISVYLPEKSKATGAAMVVCPGGGFMYQSYTDEGLLPAKELTARGIVAVVLKYRTLPFLDDKGNSIEDEQVIVKELAPKLIKAVLEKRNMTEETAKVPSRHLAFEDADRAVALVRQNAAKWGVNPNKIGIMGFSAGAITSMHQALEHSEAGKPNFVGVIYGGWTSDVKAPADAAPLYMCSPINDVFLPEETFDVMKAWRDAKVPVELHYYSDCSHGFGAQHTGKAVDMWIDGMVNFMKDTGFLQK